MTKETKFSSKGGDEVALKRVHIDGRIDGLLWSMTSQQHYLNETGKNIETVYTFPLAPGAVLLGLVVQIGEKRLHGTVVERKKATEQYEKAIDDGDMPVMVEKSASGLYTANLGNLKDGESVVIEIESASLLRVEQGQMRLQIPTVVGERYGDAHATGGLAAHETTDINALCEYPLTVNIDIMGAAASAKISCPSHKVGITAKGLGLSVAVERNSFLDRDFILNFEGLQGKSFAVVSSNEDESWVLASFCPQLESDLSLQNEPLHLKILIDCSGSMQGDSITQARNGLAAVTKLLTAADFVSFSRFGNEVDHVIPKMESCTEKFIHGLLERAIQTTEADMGGTEIPSALASIAKIRSRPNTERGVCVLLITDGEAWDIKSTVAMAQQSGHRIFSVGVGSTPAGTLLTDLAEKTGGSCELVSPNEDMGAAILRTFRRMRSIEASHLKVDWGQKPQWQSAMPMRLYENETLHLFAKFRSTPLGLPELSWKIQDREFQCVSAEMTQRQDQTLIRLGGASELETAKTTKSSLALALKYQLLSDESNLFLVHVRSEDEKATTLPALKQIAQMQAAGQSGFGSVVAYSSMLSLPILRSGDDTVSRAMYSKVSAPAVWRGARTSAAKKQDSLSNGGMDDYEIPAFLRRQVDIVSEALPEKPTPLSLPSRGTDILRRFNTLAWKETDFSVVVDALSILIAGSDTGKFLDELIAAGNDRELVWAVYIDWLITKANGMFVLDRHALRLLRHQMSEVSDQEKALLVSQLP